MMETSLRTSRLVSALELLLGATVVIAHNVYQVVPNEVPILCIAGLLSLRLREGGWAALGLNRPASWIRTIGIALGVAVLCLLMGEFVTDPLIAKIWH